MTSAARHRLPYGTPASSNPQRMMSQMIAGKTTRASPRRAWISYREIIMKKRDLQGSSGKRRGEIRFLIKLGAQCFPPPTPMLKPPVHI